MITVLVSSLVIFYLLLIVYFWFGWEKAQPCEVEEDHLLSLSVVIAVRNEEEGITGLLNDLDNQTYLKSLVEVIIIDDHSSDLTIDKIELFKGSSSLDLKLIELDDKRGKKAAMALGFSQASNDIILTTDGDCRVKTDWLKAMSACFINQKVKLVSGPVQMMLQDTFFRRMQAIEFSSLIASGAATISMNWPTMANGANMAIRRTVIGKISEMDGQKTVSGDDVFLLHKIKSAFNEAIIFCKNEEAIVETSSSAVINSFIEQRRRWAGKWQFYKDTSTILLAVFIFIVNLAIVLLPILVFSNYITWFVATNLIVVKIAFEYWYLKTVQIFFDSKIRPFEFIILAFIYPLYVSLVAITSLIGSSTWKGRVST